MPGSLICSAFQRGQHDQSGHPDPTSMHLSICKGVNMAGTGGQDKPEWGVNMNRNLQLLLHNLQALGICSEQSLI